uniref:Uncharacterized protein n=1 Tax=Nitzschia sp. (in: diatoms) TaxID=1884248 RepID=A0A5J6DUP6_9STRA|nr:hypothetical protein [Nitzschia sp. (in: diatoms)]QES95318.1 hypothetical protein [Nitzschia sp. (in: diatoms)]
MFRPKINPFLMKPRSFLDIFTILQYPEFNPIEKQHYKTPETGFISFFILDFKDIVYIPDVMIKLFTFNTEYIIQHLINYFFVFGSILCFLIFLSIFLYITRMGKTKGIFSRGIRSIQKKICNFLNINQYIFLIICYLFVCYFSKTLGKLNNIFVSYPFLHNENEKLNLLILYRYLPALWYTFGIPTSLIAFWKNQRTEIIDYLNFIFAFQI